MRRVPSSGVVGSCWTGLETPAGDGRGEGRQATTSLVLRSHGRRGRVGGCRRRPASKGARVSDRLHARVHTLDDGRASSPPASWPRVLGVGRVGTLIIGPITARVARGELLSSRPSRRVQVAALEYGYALYPNLNEAQRSTLGEIAFAAPTIGGDWLPVRSLAFSEAWGTSGGSLLTRLIEFATEETPEMSALAERILASPEGWPLMVVDQSRWVEFLRSIGVRDGLPLTEVPVEADEGNRLDPHRVGIDSGLDTATQKFWEKDVREIWQGGSHPYTRYRFASPLAILPGAVEVGRSGDECRTIYAELVALGLAAWPDEVFEVVVSRPERRVEQLDRHVWPTPLASYLRHAKWIPVEESVDEGQTSFVRPSDAWFSPGGLLPRFVSAVASRVRTRGARRPSPRSSESAGNPGLG